MVDHITQLSFEAEQNAQKAIEAAEEAICAAKIALQQAIEISLPVIEKMIGGTGEISKTAGKVARDLARDLKKIERAAPTRPQIAVQPERENEGAPEPHRNPQFFPARGY
jgi:hypothetical protein